MSTRVNSCGSDWFELYPTRGYGGLGEHDWLAGYVWRGGSERVRGPPDATCPYSSWHRLLTRVDTCRHGANRISHIFTLFSHFSTFLKFFTFFQKNTLFQEIYTFHINIRADFHKLSVFKKTRFSTRSTLLAKQTRVYTVFTEIYTFRARILPK